jgi:hypothetical protein
MDHKLDASRVTLGEVTRAQTVSLVLLAVVSGVIVAIQPVLLAAMLQEGRLTTVQLGHAATAELLGMAIMTGVAGAVFKPSGLRRVALSAVSIAALANIITMASHGDYIIVARFFSGCGAGVLLWLFISMVIRAASPSLITGTYSALMALVAVLIAVLCSQILVPRLGANGGFGALLLLILLMFVPALWTPDKFVALPKAPRHEVMLPLPGIISLLSVAAYMAAITSIWVYIVPLSAQLGFAKSTISLAVNLGIACQIIGGLAAAVLGPRLRYVVIMSACSILAISIVIGLGMVTQNLIYVFMISAIGVIWTFAPSVHVLFVIAADPSRKSAVFTVTAQMLGVAAGPFLSSLVVSGSNVRGALSVSASLFIFGLILLIGIQIWVSPLAARFANKSAGNSSSEKAI